MSFDVRLPTLRKEREGWGSQGELRRSNGWASPPIVDLVEAFERNLDSYRSSAYKEAEVRREFIDPFFDGRVGGWPAFSWTSLPQSSKRVPRPCVLCKGGAFGCVRSVRLRWAAGHWFSFTRPG